ncbi:DUF4224 domain-containing protein [Achromobacter xylosoxidans]|uniref:DUF4224 domain-containing protein n=1 Tax=Alcaligenes xylosoxydans xylosoxydans TaxID=85698 RepID=UPI001F13C448|nr:DUF4224 domain-containing protein [Achromobacter xylosoxidans]
MAEFLSPEDLRQLTGYSRPREQRQTLDEQGIPYKSIGNRTIVLSAHVAAWIEGKPMHRHSEPNMAAVT